MIKATELRMGNMVYVPTTKSGNTVARIYAIMHVDVRVQCEDEKHTFEVNQLMPILIIPEILEKCGFKNVMAERYDFPTYEHSLGDRISFDGGIYKYWLGGIYQDWAEIRSLHRLQNFFFEYNNLELEVKL